MNRAANVQNTDELNRLIAALPSDEQVAGVMLAGSLVRLSEFRNDFAGSLSLIAFSASHRGVSPDTDTVLDIWSNLAARSAVLSVFHFGHALKAISQNAELVPLFKSPELRLFRRKASNTYEACFPDIQKVRDSICHVAQNTLTKKSLDLHMVDGELSYGKFIDGKLTVTKDGRHFDFAVNETALSSLIEIGQEIYASFPSWRQALPELSRLADRAD